MTTHAPFLRIFRRGKPATQSGRARADEWVVIPEPLAGQRPSAAMGWWGSDDAGRQVELVFASKESACAWARQRQCSFRVVPERQRRVKPKAYADNFRAARRANWTH